MNSLDEQKVLVVFIGSPGDLVKERQAARKTVEKLNKPLREIGWQIDLRGWEDTLPAFGRPQELINHDIRACKLFIGLLHTRWGSPTGEYSSGFEEEYRLALDMRKHHNGPEIWLFFKRVPTAQTKDPGEQLNKVLEFKEEVKSNREILFKELSSTADWNERLPDMLLAYVLKLNEQSRTPQNDAFPPAPLVRDRKVSAADPSVAKQTIPAQLSEALSASVAQVFSPLNFTRFQAARLHLFATAMLLRHTSP